MNSRIPFRKIIDEYDSLLHTMHGASPKELGLLSKKLKQMEKKYELAKDLEKTITIQYKNTQALERERDAEMREMLEAERLEAEMMQQKIEKELLEHLTPVDERDGESILIEIRAGAGGDESSLFAGELFEAYRSMANELGYTCHIVERSGGTVGGFKEIIAEIRGDGAYGWFKYEGGVHRVQRVPETEKAGRVHTSTVSVAIMPLIESTDDFKLDPKDISVILSTSSGHGGQSVNTTYSAVRMKHVPTGIEAQSQDERDQQQNRLKALQVLTSRVYDYYEQQRIAKESAERRAQVGKADRSEKIRTYNFPQDRLTDHRYNHSWNQLPMIMSGGIIQIVQDIKKIVAEEALKQL